jgi:F-type H+-transporting ATPase subunit b
MEVLHALGIDSTVLFQFVIATFAFFALSTLVYKPYTDALLQREKRTKGGEEAAVELAKKASELRTAYEKKAREVSTQIKSIFDLQRNEATREHEMIVSKSRNETTKLIEETRHRVSTELADASKKMKEETPVIAQAMVAKLLSKKA